MNQFIDYNPQFGRKIMKRADGATGYHVTFNDKHVDFKRSSLHPVRMVYDYESEYESDDENVIT
jgi:hypothetical protein